MNPELRWIALAALAGCTNEVRLQLPEVEGARSLLVAIEGDGGELILVAHTLEDPASPPITTFTLDTEKDRLSLLYLTESLADLDLSAGELGPSAGGDGALLPDPREVYEATFAGGALEAWTPRGMAPDSVRAYRLPGQADPDPCVTFDHASIPLEPGAAVGFSVGIDDDTALIGTLDCRWYRIEDTGDDTAPVAQPMTRTSTSCRTADVYTSAIRDDDGVLWFARRDGEVDRMVPPDLGTFTSERVSTRGSPILQLAVSRGIPERELYALASEGIYARRASGWERVWRYPGGQSFRRFAWVGPGEILVIDATACVRRWRAADPTGGEDCEIVGEADVFTLFGGVGWVPGLGAVLGAVVSSGPLVNYGALFANAGEPGRWSLLALMQPVGTLISPIVIAPLDGGLLFGGFFNMIGQFHPPAAGACDIHQVGPEVNLVNWTTVVPFGGDRFLLTGLPHESGDSLGNALWLSRAR